MFEFCAVGSPCLLEDYDAFLAVAFAINLSISAWWNKLHHYIATVAKRERSRNRINLPERVAATEGTRIECEERFRVWGRVLRTYSALMAFFIALALLLLRSDTPIAFEAVTSTVAGVVFLIIIGLLYRKRLDRIDRDEKIFLEGVSAAENNVMTYRDDHGTDPD